MKDRPEVPVPERQYNYIAERFMAILDDANYLRDGDLSLEEFFKRWAPRDEDRKREGR